MARDIRKFLNSSYVKCSNNLRKREVIQVYVEDEIDKVFWYVYLHPYEELYNCTFRISTLQDRNKTLKGKASLLTYKPKETLGHNMWLCVDSDYDEIIKDFSKFSDRIRHDSFVITTYWYSIENLKCTPDLLELNILKASLADKCEIKVEAVLQMISILYKNIFYLLLEMEEKHDNRFKIDDFCQCLSYVSFKNGELDESFIKNKLGKWKQDHIFLFQQYGNRFNHWKVKLENLGFKETDYYQLYKGHGLFENIVFPLVKHFAYRGRTNEITKIVNGADKKERKDNLVTEYYNNTFTSRESTSLRERIEQLVIDNSPNMDNLASIKIKEQIEKALKVL